MPIVWSNDSKPVLTGWKGEFWSVTWRRVKRHYELDAEYLVDTVDRLAVVFRKAGERLWSARVYAVWSSEPKSVVVKIDDKFKTPQDGKNWCESEIEAAFNTLDRVGVGI